MQFSPKPNGAIVLRQDRHPLLPPSVFHHSKYILIRDFSHSRDTLADDGV